jgi:hypothetical protein
LVAHAGQTVAGLALSSLAVTEGEYRREQQAEGNDQGENKS